MTSNHDANENGFTRRTVLKSSGAVAGGGAFVGRARAGPDAVNALNLVEAGVVYDLESVDDGRRLSEVHLIDRQQYVIGPEGRRLLVALPATDAGATALRDADTLVSDPSGDLTRTDEGSTVEFSVGGSSVMPTAVTDDLRPRQGVRVTDATDERSVTLTVGPTVTVDGGHAVEPGTSEEISLGSERVTARVADQSDPDRTTTVQLDAESTLVVRNHRGIDVVDPHDR